VNRRRRKMYCGHARMCVCLSVCVSVRGGIPTLLHGPGCNLGEWWGMSPSCALLGGFAIGAWAALLWQHNTNPSYKLVSIPRYDDIVRTLGGVCARCWPVTGRRRGRSQHYCVGVDCGLPMVAFWRHNANTKCYRVHAYTHSMPS